MEILFVLVGLAVGIVIGMLYGRGKTGALTAETEMLRQQMQQARHDSDERHREAMNEQQVRFNEVIEKVKAEMQAATSDMLKQRQQEFAEQSNNSIGQIVDPLRKTISDMRQALNDNTLRQTSMTSEMRANIENMMRQSEAAQRSTEELTRAFRHETKLQGDWGEAVLDELLESQGLHRGIHYETQATMRDARGNVIRPDYGANLRPDIIMHLDKNRELIIDSKVSLSSFIDYVNAENPEERQRHLKAHVESIRRHVKELSDKDYSSYIQPPKVKMDYVIMFMPNTGALWTALKAQPDLWRKAMESNVFIADEQTLFAALRIINLTWTQIVQAENHEKVYRLAEEMLDRVGKFMKSYEEMGKQITRLQKVYEEGEKKLTPGGQSIITTSMKLMKLGARQNPKNPVAGTDDTDIIEQLPADNAYPDDNTHLEERQEENPQEKQEKSDD
ncbi:MAG: DNA recombination protein RmuC [Prevotella sp.]|uniref:DNA recombination protein RmuC n=1 Tax=Prevotella sp. TaxID=59823 RepID=UPI002A2B2A89|nr:DNA recombination protein RmuC [Prevotella sp.]MDD7318620.1 DNA recombination protein RmuC [Prevotellaceae bacterium]MDY4019424.1 DNA recombination protein RmuC [Prevotella sp.]